MRGLGGPLVLVGIGLVLTPILALYSVALVALDDAGDPLQGVLYYEAGWNVVTLGASSVLLYGFFKCRSWFPFAIIAFLVADRLASILEAILVINVEDYSPQFGGAAFAALLGAAIPAAIWIPYFSVSRRVKATFVRRG